MNQRTAHTLLLLLTLAVTAPASAIYKCDTDGKVLYSDTPCDGGKVLAVSESPPAETAAAQRQAAQERSKLKSLERERHKREAAEARDLRKASRENAARHKKCAAHQRRQRHAGEDVARSTGIANEKAKRKLRRITEEYETECGRWYEREMSVAR